MWAVRGSHSSQLIRHHSYIYNTAVNNIDDADTHLTEKKKKQNINECYNRTRNNHLAFREIFRGEITTNGCPFCPLPYTRKHSTEWYLWILFLCILFGSIMLQTRTTATDDNNDDTHKVTQQLQFPKKKKKTYIYIVLCGHIHWAQYTNLRKRIWEKYIGFIDIYTYIN